MVGFKNEELYIIQNFRQKIWQTSINYFARHVCCCFLLRRVTAYNHNVGNYQVPEQNKVLEVQFRDSEI